MNLSRHTTEDLYYHFKFCLLYNICSDSIELRLSLVHSDIQYLWQLKEIILYRMVLL